VDLKYHIYSAKLGKGKMNFFGVGSFSTPLTNYENDFLPMSIGIGSTNLGARLTVDYQNGIFFATLSSEFLWRSNVTVDKTAYYTDDIHYTNQVDVPNQQLSNLFVGIRKANLTVQAQLINMYSYGGSDIRINDFPFAGNQMNLTTLGGHVKYFLPFLTNLELIGAADFAIAGKNMGQSQTYTAGLYYIISL